MLFFFEYMFAPGVGSAEVLKKVATRRQEICFFAKAPVFYVVTRAKGVGLNEV